MFGSSKLKSVSNAIKSAASRDLSGGISSKLFELSEVSRYGMSGKVISVAFDPVQSLLALATDSGEVHVYGRQQVEVVFTLDVKQIKEMRFVKGIYLVVIDSKDSVNVLSLHRKIVLTSFFAPGKITCIETDPSLDWMLIGLQNGVTIVYDIDRDALSPFRIENLQKNTFFRRDALSPVVSLQWNPRDIGSILISYEKVTVLFSLVENKIKSHFIREIDGQPVKVIQSLFHPNGLNVLTVHEDNSFVFWDNNTGKEIVTRSLFGDDLNKKSLQSTTIFKVAWIQERDENYTSILVAGGTGDKSTGEHSLTLINLGATPLYSVTSYEKMASFYMSPTSQKLLPVPNDSPIVDFFPLADCNPHFSGNYAPKIILVLLEDGELETLLYPSGHLTYKASLFPQSISWIRPSATTSFATDVPKKTWLGMMSSTHNKDHFLKGGFPVKKSLRVHENRSALATGHTNGSVRIWDASHGELDDISVFDVNVSHSLNSSRDIIIEHISYAGETAELAVSVKSGDVVLYKFQNNKYFTTKKRDTELEMSFNRFSLNNNPNLLVDISNRAPTNIKEGFMPICAIHAGKGKVISICNSNIGFVSIAYEDGSLLVVDRRGPAVIFFDTISKFSRAKSLSVTTMQFSIMEYGDDGYSSIQLLCGTDVGELLIFKIVPGTGGRFSVQPYDATLLTDSGPIVSLSSFAKDSGEPCRATIPQMQQLSKGLKIQGYVIATGRIDIRISIPGKSREAQRKFKFPIATSGLSSIPFTNSKNEGSTTTVLIVILMNGEIKVFSVPELKEICSFTAPSNVQTKYIKESCVLINGDIVYRVGKSEALLLSVVKGSRSSLPGVAKQTDNLYNPNLHIKCRPCYNALQWARGSIYCKPAELDNLLGEQRSESKYEESKIASGTISLNPDDSNHNTHDLSSDGTHRYQPPIRYGAKSGGYGPMRSISRAVQNGLDSIEDKFNDYAVAANETMNDAIEQTGKDIVKGAFSSKFGF